MKKDKIVYKTEEQQEMIKFLVVLIVVILIIVGVYFFSKAFIKEEVKDLVYETGTVRNNVAIVGTILNNPEKEYYVLAYDTTKPDASSYSTYAGYYTGNQDGALKIYYLDLDNGLNKNYYVEEKSNPKATKISELKMLDGTLIKVKNGKIVKYIEGIDSIKNEIKVTKEKK